MATPLLTFGFWIFCILSSSLCFAQKIKNLKELALESIHYLNRIRQAPNLYSDSVGIYLGAIEPTHILEIDPVLMQIAEERALDMVRHNYFGHTSPAGHTVNSLLCDKGFKIPKEFCQFRTINNFESICGGVQRGIECINILLRDEGLNPPGHRIHLLGMDDFYKSHRRIGAALIYKKDSEYEYYFVIITTP